jgi:type III secretion protein V
MRGLKELFIPFGVMAVVAMMVFPLPPVLLDLLLIFNIGFSILLLLSALSLAEPERFTSLPTVLLLATLFRLALNIATTRQLLGEGEAPAVVAAFGETVVGGNLVVGAVVFLIITLVQFLVIAKGAERVAEVAARFTLDAMPGKQMAIDADIRAGILSLSEARERRKDLQRESRLYGALDGAMKFVKGDAIAGLIITGINIVGGLFVGIVQRGLDVFTAAHRYTIFTIGDGLVSQLPALLTAVAAGIAVTRVSDRDGASVGKELFSQLGREPQVLATAGAAMGLLALVPGLPILPLLGFGLAFFASAGGRRREIAADRLSTPGPQFRPQAQGAVMLRIGGLAARQLQQEGTLIFGLRQLKERIFAEWGLVIPEIDGALGGAADSDMVEVLFHGIRVKSVSVGENTSSEVRFVQRLLSEIEVVIRENRGELVDDLQTRILLEINEPYCEALINTVTTKHLSVTGLTKILRELVIEGIPVHSIPVILQAIAEYKCAEQQDALSLPSESLASGSVRSNSMGTVYGHVRRALRRQIVEAAFRGAERRCIWRLSAALESVLVTNAEHDVVLHPEFVRRLSERIAEVAAGTTSVSPLVILCADRVRPVLARLVRSIAAEIAVLSYDEIAGQLKTTDTANEEVGLVQAGIIELEGAADSESEVMELEQTERVDMQGVEPAAESITLLKKRRG